MDRFLGLSLSLFQSTPLVWGATAAALSRLGYDFYFNPRPPCGGRLRGIAKNPGVTIISIHAPRVGGDLPEPPKEEHT